MHVSTEAGLSRAIRAALNHRTLYRYDRLVPLSPQTIGLRPAPPCLLTPTGGVEVRPANLTPQCVGHVAVSSDSPSPAAETLADRRSALLAAAGTEDKRVVTTPPT